MTADAEWTGTRNLPELWDLVESDNAKATFGKVVLAHDLHRTHPHLADEATAVGRRLLAKFVGDHGTIQNSYYCVRVLGGCAIVEHKNGTLRERRLHSTINTSAPDLVALEDRCHTLADEANVALCRAGGRGALEPTTNAIYAAMTRVLGAADVYADPSASRADRAAALAVAKREVAEVTVRTRTTIQRHARFVYFQGTLIGAALAIAVSAVIGVLASSWEAVNASALTAATLFGALGAVVSVFQRIASGKLVLDFRASRFQLVELGMLRPAVGSIFGAVLQFALVGGLLGAGSDGRDTVQTFGLFALLGFISGFSERFATDMIERAGQVISNSATAGDAAVTGAETAEGDLSDSAAGVRSSLGPAPASRPPTG